MLSSWGEVHRAKQRATHPKDLPGEGDWALRRTFLFRFSVCSAEDVRIQKERKHREEEKLFPPKTQIPLPLWLS